MRVLHVLPGLLLAAALGAAEDQSQPRPLADNPRLEYPEYARRYAVTGDVTFAAQVDETGTVTAVDVRAVPMSEVGFEEAVRAVVSRWRFAPAVVNGAPAAGTYVATVAFRLRPADEADIGKTVAALAAAWNGQQVDAALRQFDLAAVPASAVGRVGMRNEAALREWLAAQMTPSVAVKAEARAVRFGSPSLAYVEVPRETAAGAPPAAPLHGMLVKRNDSWRLVRLDWSEAPGETLLRAGPGGNITEPRKVKDVVPDYPDSLKQARVQGTVLLDCVIDTDGKVADITVISGPERLTVPAKAAVSKWRYTPTLVDGVAVPVIMTVTVNYRLR
jgi:TonB family protein